MDLIEKDDRYELANPTHSAAEYILDTIDPNKSASLQNLILIHNVTIESIILRHPKGGREQPEYEIVLQSQDRAGAKMIEEGDIPNKLIGNIPFTQWNGVLNGLKDLGDSP